MYSSNIPSARALDNVRQQPTSRARLGRSVLDYGTEDQLRMAMISPQGANLSQSTASMIAAIHDGQPVQQVTRTTQDQSELSEHLEWVLPYHDTDLTEDECMEAEMNRLRAVESFDLLDEPRDEAFDRITELATRIFDAPISVISLLDLGRQWHVSCSGIDCPELHRKDTMCAQTVMARSNFVVVPDLTKDARFCGNVTVCNPPHSKFYASVPLLSPEGYRLGTLCIIDTVVRPQGLSTDQIKTLVDLADMTVKLMVDRRALIRKAKQREDPAQLLVDTTYDIITPLTGVQLSLRKLSDDERVKAALDECQVQTLRASVESSEFIIHTCRNALTRVGAGHLLDQRPEQRASSTTTRMDDLVRNLQMIVHALPKKVPVIISLDQSMPKEIVADDAKLFRATLCLLAYALGRTDTGTIHLTIRSDDGSAVNFECESTGADLSVEESMNLYQPSREQSQYCAGLSSIPSLMGVLDGEYGYRPRGMDVDGNALTDSNGCRPTGSIFWFSIALLTVGSSSLAPISIDADIAEAPTIDQPIRPVSHDIRGAKSPRYDHGLQSLHSEPACGRVDSVTSLAVTSWPNGLPDSGIKFVDQLGYQQLGAVLPVQLPGDVTSQRRRARVLVIDDSIDERRDLSLVLHELGYDTVQATDGIEGLKEMQRSLFDIVFCELSMPGMDGLSCVAKYRDWEKVNRPWDHQLIIGISQHAHLNDRGQALQLGMDMFYPKPMSLKAISLIQGDIDVVLRSEELDQLVSRKRSASSISKESQTQQESKSLHSMEYGSTTSALQRESAPVLHSDLLPPTFGLPAASQRHRSA